MPTTTWNSETNVASGWTTAVGTTIQSNTAISNYGDDSELQFGADNDFGIRYNSTSDRLEFTAIDDSVIASLSTTGLYLDQVNFSELSSLPGTAVEGRMIYHNNEYYLGVGS